MENDNCFLPDKEYTLLVWCATFNHSKYIEDTLNGFAMQQTDFPFVCLVMDDASTDGEQDVIKAWMSRECDMNKVETYDNSTALIFVVPHKTNVSCTFAFYLLKQNLYGTDKKKYYINPWREKCKYQALCEGDDYWIDKDKLQIQVNFLSTHPDYSMCSHRIYKYDQDSSVYYKDRLDNLFCKNDGYIIKNTTPVWLAETSTIVYRIEADVEYNNYSFMKRDNIHVYFLLKFGKGLCLSNVMSVYRQHKGGIFSKQNVSKRLMNGSYRAFKELYNVERTNDARFLYYRSYANTFILTKGRILFLERFSVVKFLSLFYFIPSILFVKHPLYEPASF